jgi:hypothetical protein
LLLSELFGNIFYLPFNLHTPSIVREFLAIREQSRKKFSAGKCNR